MKNVLLAMGLVTLILRAAVADTLSLPCDELWQINLNDGRPILGPVWSEDGSIHQLIGVGQRLLEIRDGEIVTTSDDFGSRVTAIERADVDEAEGIEALVGIVNDTLNSLLILDGVEFDRIDQIPLGENWIHYDYHDSIWYEYNSWHEQTVDLKWTGDEDSTLLVFRAIHQVTGENYVSDGIYTGVVWKINLQGELIGDSVECSDPKVEFWRDEVSDNSGYLVGGNRNDYWSGDLSGFATTSTWVTYLDENGDFEYQRQLSSQRGGPAWTLLTSIAIAPLPNGDIAAFACIVQDLSTYENPRELQCSLHLQNAVRLGAVRTFDLGPRPASSLVYLPPEANIEDRAYLMCIESNGTIRLFDLTDFRFNPQEYTWTEGRSRLLADDFDGDGRLELIGLEAGILTCARLRTLTAPPSSDFILPPSSFILLEAYPNPFNSSATIRFTLPQPGPVSLTVYDIMGRRVRDLTPVGWFEAGEHRLLLDGRSLSNGQYVLKLESQNDFSDSRILLLK